MIEKGSTATPGTGLPGRFGVDYQFINKAGIDTYVDVNKVNLFRVAFLLERMNPLETGLGATFNETVRKTFHGELTLMRPTAFRSVQGGNRLYHHNERRIRDSRSTQLHEI